MRVIERIFGAHPIGVGPLWMRADVVELDDGRPAVRVEHWCKGQAAEHFAATAPIIGGSRKFALEVAGESARKFMFDARPDLLEMLEPSVETDDDVDELEVEGRN